MKFASMPCRPGRQTYGGTKRIASQKFKGREGTKIWDQPINSMTIIRKIINIIATRCHILRLKCTKFDSCWKFDPDPAGGAYSLSLAGSKGA